MAQFIVLQDFDGKYRDNCHLHREIIQFIFEFPAILQNQSLETFIKVGEEFSAAFRLEADQETTSMETKVKMMSDLKAVHSAINCLADLVVPRESFSAASDGLSCLKRTSISRS